MTSSLPTIQLDTRPGIIELGWGHPPMDQLPVAAMQHAASTALARYGGAALTYGYMAGPGPLIEWLCERISYQEGHRPTPEEILISAGNSQALDQILTLCTEPGDTILVESPTYHLAVRILGEHPLKLVAVPTDQNGLQIDALEATLVTLRGQGIRPRLLYTIPTFHNPTGISLSPERRQVLVNLAANHNFLIVEDDVYRELSYDGPPPPSLWSLAPEQVIRLGSFSKSLAPGVRLGWMTGPRTAIQRITKGGLLDSGGGINHFTALVVAELCASGAYDQQIAHFKQLYRQQRDTLLTALAQSLPAEMRWYYPGGGFFAWLLLPDSLDARQLLPAAEAAGVAYLPGATFCIDGRGRNALRLSFSLYPPAELTEGAGRLGRVLAAHLS